MGTPLLRIKDENGMWHDIEVIRGLSAYQLAVKNGYTGTEQEWVNGIRGVAGKSAYEVAKDGGFTGTQAEWLASLKGATGDSGKSAYQVAKDGGYDGTETEWLASLKGAKGDQGKSAYQSAVDGGYSGSESDWVNSLKPSESTIISVTIASSTWNETVTVTDEHITATNNVAMIPGLNITNAQLDALQKANCQDCGTQSTGSITFKLFGDIPDIDIPIRLIIGGGI